MRNFRLLAVIVCLAWTAGAQSPSATLSSQPFHKRFSFGVRGGGPINGLMKSQTVTESTTTTDPPLSTITFSDSASKRYTVGPAIGFRLMDRLDLNLDVLFKHVGYDSGVTVQTQLTEEEIEDSDAPDFISGQYERTRADKWDVSLLLRYYTSDPEEHGSRFYLAAGPAFSSVTGIKSFSEQINDEGLSDTNSIPVSPSRDSVPGVAVGAGLQLRDEVGLKIEIEGRFTRWFQRHFEAGLTQSNVNQAEVLISFGF